MSDRHLLDGQSVSRPCPYCEDRGPTPTGPVCVPEGCACMWEPCSECDGTGQRVSTILDAGGITARVHGSEPLTPESEEALREVMRAAVKHMDGDDAR